MGSADPPTLTFEKKRALFEPADYDKNLKETRKHLRRMKEKLRPSTPGYQTDYVGDAMVAVPVEGEAEQQADYEPILGLSQTSSSVLGSLLTCVVQQPPANPFMSVQWSGAGSGRLPHQQASPLTRAYCPSQRNLMPDMPETMKRRITDEEKRRYLGSEHRAPGDYWVWAPELQELWRVHRKMRRSMFVPDPSDESFPEGFNYQCFLGPRTTQIYSAQGNSDVVFDNWRWIGWNSDLDLGHRWAGVTRFLVKPAEEVQTTLAVWLTERGPMEELWRQARMLGQEFQRKETSIGDAETWSEVFFVLKDAHEVAETFAVQRQLPPPLPLADQAGSEELQAVSGMSSVKPLPTGKVRLELKWSELTPAWKQAFEAPISNPLRVYFKHDAVCAVGLNEDLTSFQVLPSRFVLVNKADLRKPNPVDADLVGAKLKGRWVVAGHLDRQAGQYETEAPTASLLAHNLLCWLAAQFQWVMRDGDISAAFLQGEYLRSSGVFWSLLPRATPSSSSNSLGKSFRRALAQTCYALRKEASAWPRARACGSSS